MSTVIAVGVRRYSNYDKYDMALEALSCDPGCRRPAFKSGTDLLVGAHVKRVSVLTSSPKACMTPFARCLRAIIMSPDYLVICVHMCMCACTCTCAFTCIAACEGVHQVYVYVCTCEYIHVCMVCTMHMSDGQAGLNMPCIGRRSYQHRISLVQF